jgi:hypothetical protein
VTAPGVAISLSLEPNGFPEQHAFRALDFGDGVFTAFSDRSEAWPGGVAGAGVGCGPQAHPDASYVCEGVASVDLSGADQPDLLTVEGHRGFAVPVRLAGGGGA